MPKSFDNSRPRRGMGTALVETGVVANVNTRNMTVDWVSQYSGKQITDIRLLSPYQHYNNGEGFTCVPEIGALCVICFPSDDDPPFILGFISAPELEGAASGDLEKAVEDPGVESEADIPKPRTTSSGGSTDAEGNSSDASFRNGRPLLNPGDMYWQGRDENFIVLRRGGVLQLGATSICQRAYIPLLNTIRDFCENYELNTVAGSLSWSVARKENDPSGDAPSEFVLTAREFAQDKSASIKVSVGSLNFAEKPPGGEKTFIEVVIAPQLIDPSDGTVTAKPVYVIRLDKAGNSYQMQAATRTEEIGADHVVTIGGKQTVDIKGDQSLAVGGKQTISVVGEHSIAGQETSKEVWTGLKSITASALKLGDEAASEPAVLGLKLIAWLATHTHPPFLPAIQAGQVGTLISQKVFVK